MNNFTFREWVDSQHASNTPFGDFIKDAQEDTNFPNISSFEELTSYVPCDDDLPDTAWKKYKKDLSQEDTIKNTKTFVIKKFKRQIQDAKNQKIPVFKCKKQKNTMEFDCPYCLTKHRHGAEGGKLKAYELTHRVGSLWG